jgi:pimeloyl-ACP methyl ester carboxylesterase
MSYPAVETAGTLRPAVKHGSVKAEGLTTAYREAGDVANPKLVLLHGFPVSSHQHRNLIPAFANSFHVIAPVYPGFGNSDVPDPSTYGYTFDKISEVIEAFLHQKAFGRYGLYVQDYSGPVGFRIVTRHPEAEKPLAAFLEHDAIKSIYLHGAKREELISPDNWKSDFGFIERPKARPVPAQSVLRLPHERSPVTVAEVSP